MKTIQFEGQTHQFPDDFTDSEISAALSSAAPPPSAVADVAKSVGSNLAEGAIDAAGLPGTVGGGESGGWIGKIVRGGLRAAGLKNIPAEENAAAAQAKALGGPDIGAPSGQAIQSTIEQATGPLGYEPKTNLGKYAGAAARQIPMSLLLPGSAAANATVGALSGVAGEGAGQAAEKLAPNSPGLAAGARIAGSVVGGGAAAAPVNALATRAASKLVPTIEDLGTLGGGAFDAVKGLGVTLEPTAVSNGVKDIRSALTKKFGTSASETDKLLAAEQATRAPHPSPAPNPMQGMTGVTPKLAAIKAPVSTDDIQTLREQLGAITRGSNATERYAARMAQEKLDDFLANIDKKPGAVLTGDSKEAAKLFGEARSLWAAKKRAEVISGRMDLGELNAVPGGSGRLNPDANAIKSLIRPNMKGKTPAEKEGFNAAEIAQMNRVKRGDWRENLLRNNAVGMTQGTLLGGGLLGSYQNNWDPSWLAPAALATGGKAISKSMTKKQIRVLDEMVRSRVPGNYLLTSPPTRLGAGTTGALLGLNAGLNQN